MLFMAPALEATSGKRRLEDSCTLKCSRYAMTKVCFLYHIFCQNSGFHIVIRQESELEDWRCVCMCVCLCVCVFFCLSPACFLVVTGLTGKNFKIKQSRGRRPRQPRRHIAAASVHIVLGIVCSMCACSVHHVCMQCAQCVCAVCTMCACSLHNECVQCAQCVRAVCTMRACSVHNACVQCA